MEFLNSIKNNILGKKDAEVSSPRTYNREFNVVGTKYKNDDGNSRQEILTNIKEKRKPFNKTLDISIESYKYKEEDALAVMVSGKMVGNIPREDIPFFEKSKDRIVGYEDFYVWGDKEVRARVKIIVRSKT